MSCTVYCVVHNNAYVVLRHGQDLEGEPPAPAQLLRMQTASKLQSILSALDSRSAVIGSMCPPKKHLVYSSASVYLVYLSASVCLDRELNAVRSRAKVEQLQSL